jgi:hypothetical protein
MRYRWRKAGTFLKSYEATDIRSGKLVAVIVLSDHRWQWARKSSIEAYGIPSGIGVSFTLKRAKSEALRGMPGAGKNRNLADES